MIRRASVAVFWLILFGLALAGAYVTIFEAPDPSARDGAAPPVVHETRRSVADSAAQAPDALPSGRRATRAREHPDARASEPGPRGRDLRRLDREGGHAEPIARRFFSAFARYELGELDLQIEAQLSATATGRFAAELVGSPPRTPTLSSTAAPAQLGPLDFVPGEPSARGGLASAVLVGAVVRAGENSPIAIEMVQRQGRWRVAGIGR